MKAYNKIAAPVLFFVCLIVSFSRVFAQDPSGLKSEVYSKLRDRRCATMTIDKCDCPDAKEMREYVDGLIEAGFGREELFYSVAKKFSLNTIMDERIKAEIEDRLIKEAGKERPAIVIEPASFNFGKVSKSQGKIKTPFKLLNKGTAKLIVTNINVSCPCVAASLTVNKNRSPDFGTAGAAGDWQAEIEPDMSGELDVILDLKHAGVENGHLYREVTVFSNDPVYPEIRVKIEAEVD